MRVGLTAAAWFVFLYLFWKVGDPFPILSPKHGESSYVKGASDFEGQRSRLLIFVEVHGILLLLFSHFKLFLQNFISLIVNTAFQ